MPTTRHVLATIAVAVVAAAACKSGEDTRVQAAGPEFHPGERIPAGGVVPPANALSAPRPAKLDPDAGAALFS
ncbi:MAG: hypothetical protein ACREOQ_22270, partial [Gemmatimonadales bacterium]